MEKDHHNYHSSFNAVPVEYSHQSQYPLSHHHHRNLMTKFRIGEASGESSHHMNNSGMVDYLLHSHNNDNTPPHQQQPCGFYGTPAGSSFDKLSFADVMQFADFGPKLALNQTKNNCTSEGEEDQSGMDPVFFLKFPVLSDRSLEDHQNLMGTGEEEEEEGVMREDEVEEARVSDSNNTNNKSVQQHGFVGEDMEKNNSNPTSTVQENNNNTNNKSKRKRPRSIKTSEEVESQRMTHIAVERNRRKQMNEHLRVLRSLMPGSYVQRGDQASIIGGAIEFVRELEQLLQCLESQKRRRLQEEAHSRQQVGDSSSVAIQAQQQASYFPALAPLPNVEFESGLREETAENKSCLADVEVKLLGFDAMIKILSRRRPGQLIKTIAALEDLQLIILHTNITTVEQTVLYSFNVKVAGDSSFTAEDIASSVQQIFSFIHENTGM